MQSLIQLKSFTGGGDATASRWWLLGAGGRGRGAVMQCGELGFKARSRPSWLNRLWSRTGSLSFWGIFFFFLLVCHTGEYQHLLWWQNMFAKIVCTLTDYLGFKFFCPLYMATNTIWIPWANKCHHHFYVASWVTCIIVWNQQAAALPVLNLEENFGCCTSHCWLLCLCGMTNTSVTHCIVSSELLLIFFHICI